MAIEISSDEPAAGGPVLPDVPFTRLATFLTEVANQAAAASERSSILVAMIEAGGSIDIGAEMRHAGLRAAAQELASKAALAGRAADTLRALATRERAVRALFPSLTP